MNGRRLTVGALGLLGVVLACGPVPVTSTTTAPVNDCAVSSCDKYSQQGAPPECNGGTCLVASAMLPVVVVVAVPQDSYYAPSRSFLLTPSDLLNPMGSTATCPQGRCFHLPVYSAETGSYLPSAQVAQNLHFNLGNGGYTAIPVHATYRYLFPDKSGVEAYTLGLPLPPVDGLSVSQPGEVPGPFGGPAIEFKAYMQAGWYERTIMPDPPLDSAFPPDVAIVPVVSPYNLPNFVSDTLDTVDETTGNAVPTFHISRDSGLDGWTAFLRDTNTGRRLSSVATLTGNDVPGVVLPTNHHPTSGDALQNAALVVAPPPGVPVPAEIFTKNGVFPTDDIVSDLPIPVSLRATVVAADGVTPVEADVVFEMTGAYDKKNNLQKNNFEFETMANARLDPNTGTASFAETVPCGTYRVSLRPLGGASAVTLLALDVPPAKEVQTAQLSASRTVPVSGFAEVTDGRLLSGATVVAIPTQCSTVTLGTSSACLPRMRETTTGTYGTFGTCDAQGNACPLVLDPGDYLLQVRPLAGTRLPWTKPVVVVSAGDDLALTDPIVVPAPVYAGLRLVDPNENPIVRAVVSVFWPQCPGAQAIEVGEAVTDENGQYDMYLDPTITTVVCP